MLGSLDPGAIDAIQAIIDDLNGSDIDALTASGINTIFILDSLERAVGQTDPVELADQLEAIVSWMGGRDISREAGRILGTLNEILDALREETEEKSLKMKGSSSDFIERLRGPLTAIENELDKSGDFAGNELARASHAIANAAFALEDSGDWARAAEYLDEALTILDSDEVTNDGGMASTIAALEALMEEARGGEEKVMGGLKRKGLDQEARDAIIAIKNKIEEVLQANLSDGGLDRGGREDAETWADEMVERIDDLTQTIASGSFTDASYELEDIIQSANSAGLEDELQRLQNYLEGGEDTEGKSLRTKTNYTIEGIQSELREWVGWLHDAVSDGKFDGLTGVSEMLDALGQAAGSDDAREMRGFLEEAGEWAKDNDRLDFLEGIGTMIDDLNEILQDTRPEDEPMSARSLTTKGPSRARAAANALRSAANGDDAVTVACDDLLDAIDDGDMGAIMSAWDEINTAAGESYLDEIEVLDEALETIQYGKSLRRKGRNGHLSESFARLEEAIGDAKADVISDDVWDALDRAQVATWNEEIDEVEKWLQRAANLVGSPDSPTNKDAKVSAAIDDILEMLKDIQPEGMDERTMKAKSSGETIVTVHLTEPLPDGGSALETQIADLAESPGLIGQGRVVDTGTGMDIVYRFSDEGYATDFCSNVLDIPEVSGVDVEEAEEERTMNPSQRAADLLRRGQVTDLNAVDVGLNEIGDALRVKSEQRYIVSLDVGDLIDDGEAMRTIGALASDNNGRTYGSMMSSDTQWVFDTEEDAEAFCDQVNQEYASEGFEAHLYYGPDGYYKSGEGLQAKSSLAKKNYITDLASDLEGLVSDVEQVDASLSARLGTLIDEITRLGTSGLPSNSANPEDIESAWNDWNDQFSAALTDLNDLGIELRDAGAADLSTEVRALQQALASPDPIEDASIGRGINTKGLLDDPIPGAFDLAVDAVSGDAVSALQDARRLYSGGDVVGAADAVHDVVVMLGSLCPVEVMDLGSLLDGQPENTEGFGGASMKAIREVEAFHDWMLGGGPTLTVEDEGPNPSTAFSDAKAALDDAGIEYELENNGWTLICEDTPEAREVLDSVGVSYESKSATVSHRAISHVNPNQDKADEIRAYMDRVQSCTGDDLDAVEDILSDKPRGLDEDCKNDLVDIKDAMRRAYAADRSGDTQEAEDARDDLAQALSALWDSLDSLAIEFEDGAVDSASAIDIDIRRAAEEVANS